MTPYAVIWMLQKVKEDLLKEPREAIISLAKRVWPQLGPTTHGQLSLLLSLLQECLDALVSPLFAMHDVYVMLVFNICLMR